MTQAITVTTVEERFTHYPPKDKKQEKKYQGMRNNFKLCASFVALHCPDSREKSLAITKLEEALFWANAAIARNE